MVNLVLLCKEIHCYLDGKILHVDIKEVNVPDLENLTNSAPLNVELKAQRIDLQSAGAFGRLMGSRNTRWEFRGSLEYEGETVLACWKFRGMPLNVPTIFRPIILKFNADFYEHIIDGEEKYYIDILKNIRRIDGVDR